MDYVTPTEVVTDALQLARRKAALSVRSMVVRGMLAGAFLGLATSLAITVGTQGLPPIVGATLFPIGFVMLVLLGLELATGNFALLPMGLLGRVVAWRDLWRNWTWVYLGNLLGCLLYAALFYLAITSCRANDGGAVASQIKQIAQKKTLVYMAIGTSGWMTALIKGILCNWMVTIGAVLALVSRSTIGKAVAMWLPILMFFALGFEHSIVNMYVIPSAMLLGAPISVSNWWVWNQIPVTIGNILGGVIFTGLALYAAHGSQTATAPAVQTIARTVEAMLEKQPELAS